MIELLTFSGALAFGSLAFIGTWIAIVIATLVLIGLTEKQHWFWATTVFVAGFVALAAAGIFDIIKYASTDPWGVTIRVGMYILIGCFGVPSSGGSIAANNASCTTRLVRSSWQQGMCLR